MLGLRTGYNKKQREDHGPTLSKIICFGFLTEAEAAFAVETGRFRGPKLDL